MLDDSRKMSLGPFELRLGKKFVLGVWEQMVRTMGVGERAAFTVEPAVRYQPSLFFCGYVTNGFPLSGSNDVYVAVPGRHRFPAHALFTK